MPIDLFKATVIVLLILLFGSCRKKNPDMPLVVRPDNEPVEKAEPAMPSFISVTGTLVIPSSDIVLITSRTAGILKAVAFPAGTFVTKGAVLATIENIEYVRVQQQFLEAKSEFFYYGEDLKRQGGLAIENATSVKKMQQAQRDYQTSEIRFRSLEKQLALMGFDTDSLDADHLSSQITLHASISGYIDKISVHSGKPVQPGETILVLVKKYEPVISFELPEAYYTKLKTGNHIDFFFPGDSLVLYKARLTFIDRQSDAASHMFKARAMPLKSSPRLIPGMQVHLRLSL